MKTTLRPKDLLKEKGISYEMIPHPQRFTALETAEAEHVPGRVVAKVVMAKIGCKDVMFIIPADSLLDFFKLSAEFGTRDIRIEQEGEFEALFPDCEAGAMPPFGILYGIPCYVDARLLANKDIVFNAGSHDESLRMALKDYLLLSEAVIGDFSILR